LKKISIIGCIILLLASCNQNRTTRERSSEQQASTPVVVDHPAAVILNPQQKDKLTDQSGLLSPVEKILHPFHVPVIFPDRRQLDFIKSNGDRIRLDSRQYAGRYDVILFDAVNNPLPCLLRDLHKVAWSYFLHPNNGAGRQPGQVNPDQMVTVPDKNMATRSGKDFTRRQGHTRTFILTLTDTSSVPFAVRYIPGIRWVENRIDTRSSLTVTFENDLITYANTDRYFTNGITFSLQAPWLGKMQLSRLMLPYRHKSISSYSLHLVQNMYTPTDTRIAPVLHNDRPYASFLYLGFRRITSNPQRNFRLTTELDLGYIGPYSPGSYLQTLVHSTFPTNDTPMGWETQISTDVLLNYNIRVEKALVAEKNFMLAANASLKAGSLYTNAGTGFRLQAGKQENYFGSKESTDKPGWQYYFFVQAAANVIGYDATLQGGLFNHENIFRLDAKEISHVVGNAEAGFQVLYKGTGLEVAQHWLTPEYKGGMSHKWGRISLIMKL